MASISSRPHVCSTEGRGWMLHYSADLATKKTFLEVEREELGTDHGEIAGWLVEKWRFPACLADPIMWHHAPSRARTSSGDRAYSS